MKYHIIYNYTNIDGVDKLAELTCFTREVYEERVKEFKKYGCEVIDVILEKEEDE